MTVAGGVLDIYPLSPMQEGLLFHAIAEPQSRAYVVQMQFEIAGELDEEAFRAAWRALAERHDVLRTAFRYSGLERPLQVVFENREPEQHIADLEGLSAQEQSRRIAEAVAADLARGFDVQRDVLMRVSLFRTAPRLHHLLWSYHHLLLDGWCLGMLQSEFAELYAAGVAGRAPRLPAARPYRDYIDWLGEQDAEAANAHWANALRDYEQIARVPGHGHERSEMREFVLRLAPGLTARLGAAAARARVTLNTLVQGLWGVLLARYNDTDDVVFGAVVSGRPADLEGVETIVGPFINAVPVRFTFDPGAPFADALRTLQRASAAAMPFHHQRLADIGAASPLGRVPFDHVLVFDNYPAAEEAGESTEQLRFRTLEVHDRTHFDVSIVVAPGERLTLTFSYKAAAYADSDIERIAAHFETAAGSFVGAPDATASSIAVLAPEEERRLAQWGEPAGEARAAVTVVDLLRAQAERTPDAIALVFGDVRLTYAELHARADAVAARLHDVFGVRPGDRVGIVLDRSEQMVIALLAVLKSGAAYVPVDTAYPPARTAYVMSDADCRAVVTESRHRDAVPDGIRVLELPLAGAVGGEVPVAAGPGDLAYVLYTSGTTGNPKGCELTHASLAFYLQWADDFYFDSSGGGNFGLFSPLSFDLTVTSVFLPLLRGKTLTVFTQDDAPEAVLTALFDGRHGIDTVKLTPSHVSMLEYVNVSSTTVSRTIVGGEAFTPHQAQLLHRLNPSMRVFNEYGPTEATVGCIVHEVAAHEAPIPIGRPIAGSTVAILDRFRRVQPIGVSGEIYVGGPGLARGYRRRPELDCAAFLDDVVVSGRRMYRTGDYGRWLPNGEIEYLGRKDEQVKIRGFRVETGEVEHAVARLPGVAAAAVVARDGELRAYVESVRPVDAGDLRRRLSDALPPFMIPSRFVQLDRLPLTPNGKIDKLQLARRSDADPLDVAPVTYADTAEAAVAAIWTEVLGPGAYGRHDNFFDAGGHSLKAMQVVARVRKTLNVGVDLRTFLAEPTIAKLAAALQSAAPAPHAAIPRLPEREYYDVSAAQMRLWLVHRLGGDVAYNMPAAFVYAGELAMPALREALTALLERHESLRTAFVEIDGVPKQRVLATVEPPLREFDLQSEADPEAAARTIVARDALTPFVLRDAPLVRLCVMHLGPERHVLSFTIHHIIGDGWSMTVLYNDLLALYEAARSRRPSGLRPLPIQYKDYAAWQNARDRSESQAYWLAKLQGAPHALELPYDHRPAATDRDFRGATVTRRLSEAASARLRAAAGRSNTTVSNLVLAGFGLGLRQATGQADFCVGMSVANRSDADLESLIGFFVNLLAIRFEFGASETGRDVLERTIANVYEAFDHQEYPFDLLVRALDPDRIANRQPLLNVIYGFQSFRDVRAGGAEGEARASRLNEAQSFGVPFRTSKFDLCLFVSETGEALTLELEYDTGLFETSTIGALLDEIEKSFDGLAERPDDVLPQPVFAGTLDEGALLDRLQALNATGTAYPRDATVHALFAAVARAHPERVAVAHQRTRMTYGELERRSNDVAGFLIERGVGPEEFVAVLLDRTPDMVVALLGILKAGAAYVPLTSDVPYERLCATVNDTRARVLIAEKRFIRLANKLHWECPALRILLCIDTDDVYAEMEDGGIMDPAIWNHVAEQTFDDISGGGWTDSYTGEWLTRDVMDGYGENIRAKLTPLLTQSSRVLEVGCASGISMFRLAPLVETYVGTDLSPGIVRWSEGEARRRGLDNIRLAALAAHEIDRTGERDFDIIILNSVIECFSGHNYARDVLRKAIALLKPDGYLFLGNVWDQDLKAEFVRSLVDFKRRFPERSTRMKLDRSDELFLSRDYIEDLRHDFPEIESIDYSLMIGDVESELARFGFDVLIRVRKEGKSAPPAPRRREQFDRRALAPFAGLPAAERATAQSLAYMMYTSGTSGVPKGVMIEHRSVVRLVRDTNYLSFGTGDAVLQTGALGFDASTFELWGPLLNGAAVVLPAGKAFLHPTDLRQLIADNGVTTLFLTTSLFNQIVDLNIDALSGLKTLLTGGEKASAAHFNAVRARFANLTLLHVYGPTENTTFSTWYPVAGAHDRDVPIGRPISNSTAVVVDGDLRPVPFGTLGELCLGGDGLARGYWKDPGLTAQKFVTLPGSGERVYRTGDFVRWQPNGEIDFAGRVDTQIKIRGYRVELEELETVLMRHHGVTAAAVVAGDYGRGEMEIVAFVAGHEIDGDAVRAFARAELPDVLVPSRVIVVSKMPLNANGKIDRRQLAVPDASRSAESIVPPQSDVEEQLLDIWRRLLGRRDIGVTDNFFRLGGHSLSVARMVSMIQTELGIELALNVAFRAATIREIALHVNDSAGFDRRLLDDELVALNAVAGGQPIIAFPPGSGYSLSYLRLATRLTQPLLGAGFIEADTRMADYVEMIRAAHAPPYVLFGYSAGGKLAFRVAQELERAGLPVSDVVIFDSACYLRPIEFSDADIREGATEFLAEIVSTVLREQAITRIKAYRRFLGQCVETGTVAANIHLVVAEGSERIVHDAAGVPIASLDVWQSLTTGSFHEYRGSGSHRDMLKPEHLERNIDILRAAVSARTPALT